jgi:hypothetical protein
MLVDGMKWFQGQPQFAAADWDCPLLCTDFRRNQRLQFYIFFCRSYLLSHPAWWFLGIYAAWAKASKIVKAKE